jgi:ABC-type nitrate/sulfonate/bicarbonate transport system ATPase subunit
MRGGKMKISNLTKKFVNKVIFNNFNFEFIENKITYIMGESGSGKTTLLRIIAGLDNEYQGNVEKNNNISYVFQEPRLFPAINVKENILISSENSQYNVDDLLDMLELKGEEEAAISSLSGGMKMRVALARTLYCDGDLFLMDEPFSALDEELKSRILPKIFSFLRNKTVIIVSHNLDEANKYADIILNLNEFN